MKWTTVRNENKEIVKRVLNERIEIVKEDCGSLKCDGSVNVLYVDGKNIVDTNPGSGYTLKDLRELGERYL